jgi:hypothetical protein
VIGASEFESRAEEATNVLQSFDERDDLDAPVSTRLETPSAKTAFYPCCEDEEPWIDVVRSVAATYADTEAIEDDIGVIEGEIDDSM